MHDFIIFFFFYLLECYKAFGNISLKTAMNNPRMMTCIYSFYFFLLNIRIRSWENYNVWLLQHVLHACVITWYFIVSGVIIM